MFTEIEKNYCVGGVIDSNKVKKSGHMKLQPKKRHFNMASLASDLVLVIKAKSMSDCFITIVARELGIGVQRMKRIANEFGLKFKTKPSHPKNKKRKPCSILESGQMEYRNGIAIKRCSKCKEIKGVEWFHADPTKTSGFRSHCKECSKMRQYKTRKLTVQELALAHELKENNCTLKHIAIGMGCNMNVLKNSLQLITKNGFLNHG